MPPCSPSPPLPSPCCPAEDPVGTVVFFHGCARFGRHFFPFNSCCPECVGMPDHISHTKQVGVRVG